MVFALRLQSILDILKPKHESYYQQTEVLYESVLHLILPKAWNFLELNSRSVSMMYSSTN